MKGSLRGTLITSILACVCMSLSGCGDDDGGGNKVPEIGPVIGFFGVTRADDTLLDQSGMTGDGTPIFTRIAGVTGVASGFALVVEGHPGSSGAAIGVSSYQADLSSFPDLVVQVSRDLGNGSEQVCDDPMLMPGGVPGTSNYDYEETPENIARVNDFSCRFVDGAGEPVARQTSTDSCVNFNGDFRFVDPQTTAQFCGFVNVPLGFPMGDTTVAASLRDVEGNLGPEAKVIIRVVP
jgi:hypothetical protein